ncbi:MAG: hypothetical protein RBS96_08345 [Dehalococcoidales bacterium]|jgi:hypothetical protein|nr:hypothetical protein [Dehalococcoidales bacterium]
MQFLTKEAIKSLAAKPRVEKVELPEWDGFIYVREMSAKARDAFESSTFVFDKKGNLDKNMSNYRARFVVLTACDEDGNLVFSPSDAEWLGEKQAATVSKIYDAAQKLNSLPTEEVLEKNSDAPADASSSD